MKPVLAVTVGALAAGLYLVGLALDLFWLKLLTKPWPVLMLASAAWTVGGTRAARLVAAGLLAGAIGDVCLALPNAFLSGMLAFAVGHGLYIAAFLQWNRRPALPLIPPVAAFCGTGLLLMLPGAGAMAVPLAVYSIAIGIMIWRAAACALELQTNLLLRWGPLAGAVLFGFSDTLIGINRFALPLPGSAYAIILTYWLAQVLLAASAIARRDR